MPLMELSWETWRSIIDALIANPLPYSLEHAGLIERQVELGLPLPPMER